MPSGQREICCRSSRSVWSSSPSITLAEPVGAVARGELLQSALADRARGDLRVEVAGRLVRHADVGAEDPEDAVDRLPASYSFTQGMRRPSWKTSVLSHAIVPGTRPPTSAWCAMLTPKPISRPSAKAGLTTKMSGVWLAPSNGSLTM